MTLAFLDVSSKKMPIETFHISSKQQVGIKSICTEERGGKLRQLQICVQISVVNGAVPSS